jgi:sulfur-carrier protein
MVQLRYFASLREALGIGEEQLALPDNITTVAQLSAWLQTRGTDWQLALGDPRLHTAINQAVVRPDARIHDGDEIAWFPPVTGG